MRRHPAVPIIAVWQPNAARRTWVGRRKGPGRGEGISGLVFDELETD